jgi:hypothetical protein
LVVSVNADGPRTLQAPETFEAEGGFEIVLTNEGDPTHVHLSLDGDAAAVLDLPATNRFVERGATERIRVEVPDGTDTAGRLRVATGYGATTRTVDLAVSTPKPVQVDESFDAPPAPAPEPAFDRGTVAGVAAVAVVLLAATALGADAGGPTLALVAFLVAATAVGAAYAAYRFAGRV